MINFIKSTLYWIGLGLLYTIRILSTGMTAGVIAFVLLGPLFGSYTHDALFLKGASVGFRYTGVWAGGDSSGETYAADTSSEH